MPTDELILHKGNGLRRIVFRADSADDGGNAYGVAFVHEVLSRNRVTKGLAPMPRIEIYSSPLCPFCWQARWLLRRKGVEVHKIPIRMYLGVKLPTRAFREMVERSGGDTTVPQIFVDGVYLGTEEHLARLEAAGQLNGILSGQRPVPAPKH